MYGNQPYGSTAYGDVYEPIIAVTVSPDVLTVSAELKTSVIFVEEPAAFVSASAAILAPTVLVQNREITIKVNDIDITDQVLLASLNVNNNLYSDPDTANFEIIQSSLKTYVPSSGDEISIEDTGIKIFGGPLIRKSKGLDGFIESFVLEFKDWTEEIGNILVAETYVNETVEDIIADIFTNVNLSAYDGTTNVVDTTIVSNITFDNISVVECLDMLSNLSGKKWYVDPNKNIYFFAENLIQSPFDLTDTNGKYDYSSLSIDEDLTQIRNKVIVKGKGIAAVTVEDAASQASYGLKEYFFRNDEITSVVEATQQANAFLAAYKDPIRTVTFRTVINGLFSGQQIDIDSVIRGINETLNIEKVTFRTNHPNRFSYSVKATSQRINGINDLFTDQTIVPANNPAIGDQSNLQNISFTAIDDETISWSAGSIVLSDGTTYSISANTSQILTADHVIYFDPSVSTTVLQISTNFADGIGQGKISLAFATKSPIATKGADIFPVTFGGQIQLDGSVHITDRSIIASNIAANSITANEISANTITANEMNVSQLSAISADVGALTAGSITGLTFRAASGSTGANILIDPTVRSISFLYDNVEKSFISGNSFGDLFLDADRILVLRADGVNDQVQIEAGGLAGIVCGENASSSTKQIQLDATASGSSIAMGAASSIFITESDNVDIDFNSDNDNSDCRWYSDFLKVMQLNQDGDLSIEGGYSSGGADFAEMFESVNGKKLETGLSVFIKGGKITEAKKGDEPIGVISNNPTIIGNIGGSDNDSCWQGKYLKNEAGEYIYEDAEYWSIRKVEGLKRRKKGKQKKLKKGNRSGWVDRTKRVPAIANISIKSRKIINPEYNDKENYISRIDRDEWNVVGLLGIVPVKKGQVIGKNWIMIKKLSNKYTQYLIK